MDVGGAVPYDGRVALEGRSRREAHEVVPFPTLAVLPQPLILLSRLSHTISQRFSVLACDNTVSFCPFQSRGNSVCLM